MPPAAPAATPAPIHEIVDILPIFPYPLWMVVLAAIALLAAVAGLVWLIFFRRKPAQPLSPRARAIAALVKLQSEPLTPYEFAVRISEILRQFIDEAFGIRAISATSFEFLESIRENPRFTSEERASLRDFLETADLIKFARMEAGSEELARLFRAAEAVVRKEDPAPAK